MHILDSKVFHKSLKDKGYRSIGEFAKSLGIHRNTIHYYLSGHGVFPESLEKIIAALGLKPHEILIEEKKGEGPMIEPIAPLVDQLQKKFADVTFILFGSRSRGAAQKYSDWDLGVYSSKEIPHKLYRDILKFKDDIVEDLPFFVDIVNLNRADDYFLREASKYWMFLAGKLSDWVEIQRKVAA